MSGLGLLYLRGQGVPQSNERAVEWLKRAVLHGNMSAQAMLGLCHEDGIGCVPKDYLEARRLYTLASAQGDAPAIERLTRLEVKIRAECPLLGKRVIITGTSRGDLNGRVGVARSFDEAKGRYVVELDREGDGAASKEHLQIKPGNLIIAHDKDSNAVRKKGNKGGKRKTETARERGRGSEMCTREGVEQAVPGKMCN